MLMVVYPIMKTATFQIFIRRHRKKLIKAGLNPNTVRSWAYGYRTPDMENALKISRITGCKLEDIPYRQIIFHRP